MILVITGIFNLASLWIDFNLCPYTVCILAQALCNLLLDVDVYVLVKSVTCEDDCHNALDCSAVLATTGCFHL